MRIVIVLSLFLFSLYASPNVAKTLCYYNDYEQALAVAQLEKKPLMLVVVTSYCPWCRKFERKTLASKAVAAMVKESYIAVNVDRNKDAKTFPKRYQTPRIPTVYFIDSQSKQSYWQSVGYLNKSDFEEALEDAEKLYDKLNKERG